MNLVNLTPHALVLRSPDGTDTVLPPSGTVARVSTTPGGIYRKEGIPVLVALPTTYGDIEGIPPPRDGVCYIVSSMVLARVDKRPDVFAPGTGPSDNPVRDAQGRIIAVTRMIGCDYKDEDY